MNTRKTLDLNPTSFYMQVDSGSVDTGAQWEADYQAALKAADILYRDDEDELEAWQEPNLLEVEKDENGNWVEKN